ncbi:MAG: sulfur carrier protein ThiS [Prevotellaceae bacterium]|jgi:sulfur carrier protein|nr:sulfur carrier protein ThiS [Prevotellaceae bacterium]
MAKITVNGKPQELQAPTTLAQLMALNSVVQPDMVSVQLNEEFVLKDRYEATVLKDGDEVDFLYFMGGGLR